MMIRSAVDRSAVYHVFKVVCVASASVTKSAAEAAGGGFVPAVEEAQDVEIDAADVSWVAGAAETPTVAAAEFTTEGLAVCGINWVVSSW
jgi:6,7-dimethyl-8-ribityllumazine synthase